MWGSGVTRENSILGFLEQKLDPKGSYEIVNAAVVGYSTYQELLNLQQNIVPLKPNIVLVNFCENDLLPTEDPFKNARQIHVQYLNHLLEDRNLKFTPQEESGIKDLIRTFQSAELVWPAVNKFQEQSPDQSDLAWKVFVLIPMARMAELSKKAGIRLIYLFIPPRGHSVLYAQAVEQLKKLLTEKRRGVPGSTSSAGPRLQRSYNHKK